MNTYHKELLKKFKADAKPTHATGYFDLDKYLGNTDPKYHLSNPDMRKLAKDWVKAHKEISVKDFTDMMRSLYKGKSFEEKVFGGLLLQAFPKIRKELDPLVLFDWLERLKGWCEVDMTCQMAFSADDLQANWPAWKKLFAQLVKDKNVSRRRASLVLLAKPLRDSNDERIYKLAINNVEKLKSEKDIMITKAISWILRNSSLYHKSEIKEYILTNNESLPKIAVREALKKIETGRK